jgi:S-adenosyl-L-methionine hydrolase (adenosine-forming)
MARSVIAFLTDFGLRDHYVGAMKGAALTICPDATLVDITHDIPPQDVFAAALELASAYKYFPHGTVFVAVVDPGVGSGRRVVAMQGGGFRFIAPDNGLLTLVWRDLKSAQIVEVTDPQYARPIVSRTFEGRDRFAPAAAWLANGVALSALGASLRGLIELEVPTPSTADNRLHGEVLVVDRFGNLVTNIDRTTFERFVRGATATVAVGAHGGIPIVGTYAESPPGRTSALFGSSDRLEIALFQGSAAVELDAARAAPVVVTRT